MSGALLQIRGLNKSFPGVRALAGVDMDVDAGEIVALLGQNGSGKSTLVKVLAGVYEPDPGSRIHVDGEAVEGGRNDRLHFIHQDLGLIDQMSAIDNFDLGRSSGWRAILPFKARAEVRAARKQIQVYGVDFPLRAPVGSLTAAERTIIAIVRALADWTHQRNVLVLDEPTAALHGREVATLFDAVREVARSGAGVIFVSHRLDEVLELADRVIVLRDGAEVLNAHCKDIDHASLARAIAGREVREHQPSAMTSANKQVLVVTDLSTETVRKASLSVSTGEIVGVTGLIGSGAESVLGAICGATPRISGEVRVGDHQLAADPVSALRSGLAFVPADRKRLGAIMRMNVRENLTLAELGSLRTRSGQLGRRAEREESDRWIEAVDVRPRDPERSFELLSGGNQQKVVIAKYLRTKPRVLLLDEPTQGVDIGAKQSIYELIAGAAADGAAAVVYSSDTKELATLCHRVLVFRDGLLAAQITGSQVTEERLLRESVGLMTTDDDVLTQ